MENEIELNYFCDECEKASKVYCKQCQCGFCQEHDEFRHSKAMVGHERYTIQDKTDFHILLCSKHPTIINSFFCKNCNHSVCKKCQRTDHFHHDCVPLEKALEEVIESQRITHTRYQKQIENFQTFQKQTDLTILQSEKNLGIEKEEINKKFQILMDAIENQRKQTLSQLVNKYQVKIEKLKDNKALLQDSYQKLNRYVEGFKLVNQSKENFQNVDYLFLHTALELKSFSQEIVPIDLPPTPNPSSVNIPKFDINEQLESIKKLNVNSGFDINKTTVYIPNSTVLGSPITIKCQVRNHEDEIILTNLDLDFDVWVFLEDNSKSYKVKMDHNENGYYAGSVLPECVGSYDVYVKINENFLTQDESPSGGFVIKGGYDIKNCTIEYEKLVFPNSNSYVFFKLLDSNDEKVIVSSSPKLTLELTNISNLKETFRLKKVKNKDAVYGCLLKLSKEGTYSFTVTIDGQLMQEEPFIFTVGHNTTQLTEGKNIHSSVSDLFKIGSSKDIKACFQLLNNQMTAINLKNTGSTPRYLFSKAILKSPQKYRFIFRVEKRASSMCFGIGKFTGNYTESINECYLWDCGNACKIRFGLEEKYGTVVHIGQTVIVQINLKKRYIKFGKEKKLFDVAFSDIPQRCILIVAMFSKKDQITVI